MSEKSRRGTIKVEGQITLVADKVSVVTGASVSEVRSVLAEAGFDEFDIQIQGIDIDDLDKEAMAQILGEDIDAVRSLPILIRGIGTTSLNVLLKRLKNVTVQSGGLDGPASNALTCCTVTLSIPDTSTAKVIPMMTMPMTVTVPSGPSGPPRDPLVLEGIDIETLRRILGNAGFDLDKIRVRPLR